MPLIGLSAFARVVSRDAPPLIHCRGYLDGINRFNVGAETRELDGGFSFMGLTTLVR